MGGNGDRDRAVGRLLLACDWDGGGFQEENWDLGAGRKRGALEADVIQRSGKAGCLGGWCSLWDRHPLEQSINSQGISRREEQFQANPNAKTLALTWHFLG